MATLQIDRNTLRDKIHACWMGKNIGGTLGAPDECKKFYHDLDFYDPLPDKSAPNDDLDLQLVWLCMMEKEGLPPKLPHFAAYWREYLHKYPWNEYGFCSRNLNRGLVPPVSGWFENFYVDEMGSPIRSEIWACVAPADPQAAAALAWMDSALDHAGGEGTFGEMFWAAVESAAFVLDDPAELIRIGLAMINPASNISRVIREALWCYENGVRYCDARERITRIYYREQPCNAIPNHGYTVLGWLYGDDFGDKLCKAVNCGFDTDCTGATLGSLLGILGGMTGIPKRWSDPIGSEIVLHEYTGDCGIPKTLDELTDRTLALAEQYVAAADNGIVIGEGAVTPPDLLARLHRNEKAADALAQDIRAARLLDGDVEIDFHYNGDPVLMPGVARRVSVTCRNESDAVPAAVRLEAPKGWTVAPVEGQAHDFDLTAPDFDAGEDLTVEADINGRTVRGTVRVLSPREARGYPSQVQSTVWKPGMRVTRSDGTHIGFAEK